MDASLFPAIPIPCRVGTRNDFELLFSGAAPAAGKTIGRLARTAGAQTSANMRPLQPILRPVGQGKGKNPQRAFGRGASRYGEHPAGVRETAAGAASSLHQFLPQIRQYE